MKIDGRSALVGLVIGVGGFILLGQAQIGGFESPHKYSPWMGGEEPAFVSQSADGKTLYFWGPKLKPVVADPSSEIQIQTVARDKSAVEPDVGSEVARAESVWERFEKENPSVPGRMMWDIEVAKFQDQGLKGAALESAAESAWAQDVTAYKAKHHLP